MSARAFAAAAIATPSFLIKSKTTVNEEVSIKRKEQNRSNDTEIRSVMLGLTLLLLVLVNFFLSDSGREWLVDAHSSFDSIHRALNTCPFDH